MLHLKQNAALLFSVTATIIAAWAYLFYQHDQMNSLPMTDMWMPPSESSAWHWTDFSLVYFMWAVMMAAMMLPSALPMILAFAGVCRKLNKSSHSVTLFILAYLAIWLIFSIALTLLQWQLHGLAWLSPMMDNQNTLSAAAILIFAGIYQFSPLKNACLTHCKSPVGFLMNEWRDGPIGALSMGTTHGLHCLGCCWTQMLLMFVVGVMNLTGMALITLLVLAEKTVPVKAASISRAVGLVFFAWAAWLLTSI